MKIFAKKDAYKLFAALHSNVRLNIIEELSKKDMNIKQLADSSNVSSAIMTKHVRQLEDAGIIESYAKKGSAGTQKMCRLILNTLEIQFPLKKSKSLKHLVDIPVGHYSSIEVTPTCGLATIEHLIGQFDDPKYFFSSERMNASILWFSTGKISYTFINPLLTSQKSTSIDITMEISSEAPGINSEWPSDINFALNDTHLGYWTSPGDFGDKAGRYTPKWWKVDVNQYGLLKIITINNIGTFIDGQKISDKNIDDIDISKNNFVLNLWVDEASIHAGGLTIFGKGFGNYNQNIEVSINYENIIKSSNNLHI